MKEKLSSILNRAVPGVIFLVGVGSGVTLKLTNNSSLEQTLKFGPAIAGGVSGVVVNYIDKKLNLIGKDCEDYFVGGLAMGSLIGGVGTALGYYFS